MLNRLVLNFLQIIGFGLRVKMNGKPYVSVIRFDERTFLAVEDGKPMPSPVCLIQADLAVEGTGDAPDPNKGQTAGGTAEGQGQGVADTAGQKLPTTGGSSEGDGTPTIQ